MSKVKRLINAAAWCAKTVSVVRKGEERFRYRTVTTDLIMRVNVITTTTWLGIYYKNIDTLQDFVETHRTCKLCVILRSRVLRGVCPHKDVGRRLPLELQCSLYQGQQGDVNQSVRGNYKTGF